MSPKREHRVLPLGNGRYRLITTVTSVIESIVDADKLRAMNLPVPDASDVPWGEAPRVERIYRRGAGSVDPEMEAALIHWQRELGGHDPRIASQMPGWLREFGLAGVRQAIDIIAHGMPKASTSAKYAAIVRVFRKMRERGSTP